MCLLGTASDSLTANMLKWVVQETVTFIDISVGGLRDMDLMSLIIVEHAVLVVGARARPRASDDVVKINSKGPPIENLHP